MRFSGVGAQAADRLHGCFRQFKARSGVIEAEEINPVMRSRELAISIKEQRIARDGLIKQLHGLQQIFFCPGAKGNAIDEVFGPRVTVVSDKVRGRRLFDGGFSVDETSLRADLRLFARSRFGG